MLNNRIMRAIEFCQKGLSFSQMGQCLGIGSERARKIIRKCERHLEALNDPLVLIIKELRSLGDATRILKALKGKDFYDGDPEKLAKCSPEELTKTRGLGIKSVCVIANALESIGIIGNAEKWLE